MTDIDQTVQVVHDDRFTQVLVGRDHQDFSYAAGWWGVTNKLQPNDKGHTQWDLAVQLFLIGASIQLVANPLGSSKNLIAASFLCPYAVTPEDFGKMANMTAQMVHAVSLKLRRISFVHPNFKSDAFDKEDPLIEATVEFADGSGELLQFQMDRHLSTKAWNRIITMDKELRAMVPQYLRFPGFNKRKPSPDMTFAEA